MIGPVSSLHSMAGQPKSSHSLQKIAGLGLELDRLAVLGALLANHQAGVLGHHDRGAGMLDRLQQRLAQLLEVVGIDGADETHARWTSTSLTRSTCGAAHPSMVLPLAGFSC